MSKEVVKTGRKAGFYVSPTKRFCFIKKTPYGFEVHFKDAKDPIYFNTPAWEAATGYEEIEPFIERVDPEMESHVLIDGKRRGVFFSPLDASTFLRANLKQFEYGAALVAKERKVSIAREFQLDIVGVGTYLHQKHSVDKEGVYTTDYLELGKDYVSYSANNAAYPYGWDPDHYD